jgi:hypothetical protein
VDFEKAGYAMIDCGIAILRSNKRGHIGWLRRIILANAARLRWEGQRPLSSDAYQPRPTSGILVAITVMKSTFASGGRLAM